MATENTTRSAPPVALNQTETRAKKIDNTTKRVVEAAGYHAAKPSPQPSDTTQRSVEAAGHNTTAKPIVTPSSQPFGTATRSVEAGREAAKPALEPSSQTLDLDKARDKAREQAVRTAHDVARNAGETLDQVNNIARGTVEAGHKATQQIYEQSSQQLEKVMARTHLASYALVRHAGENLTQVAQVTHVVTAGYPSVASKLVEYAHQTAQRNVDTLNQLLQARTVNDALQLQTQYFRDSLGAFLKTSAQIAQVATDTANEARQKLNHRST
jgi:hypothetical protein